ncbi:MAG: PilZ domain-containing protein [Elusimicrobiota bacterium]
MDPKNRREHPRFEGQFNVDLLNLGDDPVFSPFEAVVAGHALDVSMKGMRLKVPYNVPVGSILSVILYYKGHESICLCDVKWKTQEGSQKLYGLYIKEWCKLDRALSSALKEVIHSEALQRETASRP